MEFYFFLVILIVGILLQFYFIKRRDNKIANLNDKIYELQKNIISKTDKLVDKIKYIEDKFSEIEISNEKAFSENRPVSLIADQAYFFQLNKLESVIDEWRKIDERYIYQSQLIETYYHDEEKKYFEIIHSAEILGIGRYIDVNDLKKVLGFYDSKENDAFKEDKTKTNRKELPGNDYLRLVISR